MLCVMSMVIMIIISVDLGAQNKPHESIISHNKLILIEEILQDISK
jgi:uncharacterized membrane protein YciS (DUF1049 family)